MDHVTEGHYYQSQIGSKNKVIAWSHQSRFDKALDLIGHGTQKLLDYGCGDGTFLALAQDRFVEGHGVDVDADQISGCRERLADIDNVNFFTNAELADPKHDGTYDVVTCMETLEHCTAPVVESVLVDVARLVAPNGRVIISVPVEIGPSFMVKQSVRAIARRQGASSYQLQEKYPVGQALKMLFARRGTSIDRPVYGEPPLTGHSHFGFNWRHLRGRVSQHLKVERTLYTPLGFLGGWFSSQAYFVCRPKD
ncbi:class I SAM-dependent methyltransferase [Mycobacterium sp.]|uniref:class I SAM-dependent methyltransferase n=1 Tax=Mycobacterium sp. TaxID=1785 RepID=UPI002D9D7392|nr:class I SAM-dependent methyltransferase [Mycobacterium sp.]